MFLSLIRGPSTSADVRWICPSSQKYCFVGVWNPVCVIYIKTPPSSHASILRDMIIRTCCLHHRLCTSMVLQIRTSAAATGCCCCCSVCCCCPVCCCWPCHDRTLGRVETRYKWSHLSHFLLFFFAPLHPTRLLSCLVRAPRAQDGLFPPPYLPLEFQKSNAYHPIILCRTGSRQLYIFFFFFFFFSTLSLSSFWTSRGHRCDPFSSPVLAFNFYRA